MNFRSTIYQSFVFVCLLAGLVAGANNAMAEIIEVPVPVSAEDFLVEVGTPGMVINSIAYSVSGTSTPTLMECQEWDSMFFEWRTLFTLYWGDYMTIAVASDNCQSDGEWRIPAGDFLADSTELWSDPSCFDPLIENTFLVSIYAGGFPYDEWCGSWDDTLDRRTIAIESGSLQFDGDLILKFDVTSPVATENQIWGAVKATYR